MPVRPFTHRMASLGALAIAAACALSLAWGAAAPSADEGRKVFADNCAGYHSFGGKGGTVGPKLDGIGAKHDADWLRKKIVNPKFNNPNTIMPAMALPPRSLDALVGLLAGPKPSSSPSSEEKKSTEKEPTPAPSPDLMAAHGVSPEQNTRGRTIYTEKGCNSCHSLGGEGGTVGPALDDVGTKRDDAWLRVQITNPKAHNPNTIMPATPLPPADLDALAGFLAAQKGTAPPSTIPKAPTGPATFVGSAACVPCHRDLTHEFQKTVHSDALLLVHGPAGKTGCEACHGPGSLHAATGDPKLIVNPRSVTPRRNSELCLRCHTGQVSSHDWLTSAHSQAGISCSSCHQVMKQVVSKLLLRPANELCVQCHRKEAAEFAGVSHHPVPEGRMSCIDCHNPHSGVNEAMLRLPGNAMCLSCHSDKQGPFVFEHPAVNGGFTEGCMSCHQPHGSPFKDLRRIAGRGLCVQCHTDKAATHFPTHPDCTESGCHVAIHGSHEDPVLRH